VERKKGAHGQEGRAEVDLWPVFDQVHVSARQIREAVESVDGGRHCLGRMAFGKFVITGDSERRGNTN